MGAEGPRSLAVRAYLDTYYAYNANRPADHANFFAGTGTSAKRASEFAVNLAQLELSQPARPLGFVLTLGLGNALDVVHVGEPRGTATGLDTWRHLVQASIQWQTRVGRGLRLEAGVFPSHVGMETLTMADNWNHTRSWLGELSPYYQTGIKLSYPLSPRWSAQLHVLNGWQVIGDNNRSRSVGTQIAYTHGLWSLSLNTLVGPERADNDNARRWFGDLVVALKATPELSFGLSLDGAREVRQLGRRARWHGVGLYGRFAPPNSRNAVAVRAEHYDDRDGAISGVPQELRELTVTLERRPLDALLLRLEGRYDRSTAPVFAGSKRGGTGLPRGRHDQFLLLVAAATRF